MGLAEDMLTQWQEDEDAVQELKVCWPERMQQLLIGIAATHQQLQAAAGDNTVAAVTAAVQAAKQVVGETAGGVMGETAVAAAAGAAAFAAVAATAAVAPLAQDAAAMAAAAAATGSGPAWPCGSRRRHTDRRCSRKAKQACNKDGRVRCA